MLTPCWFAQQHFLLSEIATSSCVGTIRVMGSVHGSAESTRFVEQVYSRATPRSSENPRRHVSSAHLRHLRSETDQQRHWPRGQSSNGKRIETSLWAGKNAKQSEPRPELPARARFEFLNRQAESAPEPAPGDAGAGVRPFVRRLAPQRHRFECVWVRGAAFPTKLVRTASLLPRIGKRIKAFK